jgi:thiol-disulfide isomerase/thioredoxin
MKQLPLLMKVVFTFIFLTGIFSFNQTFSQWTIKKQFSFDLPLNDDAGTKKIKPLTVGQKVPNIEFRLVNSDKKKVSISDYRGKLLILDFWSTWCKACVYMFPKLDSIQKEFKNDIQILLVDCKGTGDKDSDVIEFFKNKKNPGGEPFALPSAVEDTIAEAYFEHNALPHYAWITPDGTLYALTSLREITRQNIRAVLNGQRLRLPVKIDFNEKKNFYPGNDSTVNNSSTFSWFDANETETGVPLTRARRTEDGTIRGLAMRNTSILEMYETIFSMNPVIPFWKNRLIVETTAKDKLAKICTYDFIIPVDDHADLYNLLLADINKHLDLVGSMEMRPFKHLKLVRTSSINKIQTQGGKDLDSLTAERTRVLKNMPFAYTFVILNKMEGLPMPITDGTDYSATNVDIILPERFESLEKLKMYLKNYDLDVLEVNEPITVFVITDKK